MPRTLRSPPVSAPTPTSPTSASTRRATNGGATSSRPCSKRFPHRRGPDRCPPRRVWKNLYAVRRAGGAMMEELLAAHVSRPGRGRHRSSRSARSGTCRYADPVRPGRRGRRADRLHARLTRLPAPGQSRRSPAPGRSTLGAVGLVKPAIREYLHTLYQFTDRWVVDDSKFRAAFRDRATPLDEALATTLGSYRTGRSVRAAPADAAPSSIHHLRLSARTEEQP